MKNENTVATGESQVASASAAAEQTASAILTAGKPLVDIEDALAILATSKSRASGGAKIRPNVG